jgi:hypothetical protein
MRFIYLGLTTIIIISCSQNKKLEEYNSFEVIKKEDLSQLDSLNQIIFRNRDKLNTKDFESALKGHDSIQYQKSYKAFERIQTDSSIKGFELFPIDLNTKDSTIEYQIKMEAIGNIRVFHRLSFRQKGFPDSLHGKDDQVVKAKLLTPQWEYEIVND